MKMKLTSFSLIAIIFALAWSGVNSQMFNPNCALVVPVNPLSAAGLSTPYQLKSLAAVAGQTDCAQMNFDAHGTFVEAVIFDTNTGELKVYHPLVITAGLTPTVVPQPPVLTVTSVVGIWFSSNAKTLTLQEAAVGALVTGGCINGGNPAAGPVVGGEVMGRFAACNAANFFNAVNTWIKAGKTLNPIMPTPKMATDNKPCPTTRDFSFASAEPSSGVATTYLLDMATGITVQNTAANALAMPNAKVIAGNSDISIYVNSLYNSILGCAQNVYRAPSSIEGPGKMLGSLALSEIYAAAMMTNPMAMVPRGDPSVLDIVLPNLPNIGKLNNRRLLTNQPVVTDLAHAPTAQYCIHFTDQHLNRLNNNMNVLNVADPIFGPNLFNFLANRAGAAFITLKCDVFLDVVPPVTVTVVNNVVMQANIRPVNVNGLVDSAIDPYMPYAPSVAPTNPAPTYYPPGPTQPGPTQPGPTQPGPTATPAPNNPCPNGCSGNGVCANTNPPVCHCKSAEYLGPACAVTNGIQMQLSPVHGLTLTTAVDPTDPQIMHFRVETPTERNWIGVGIGTEDVEDGMKGADMWAAYQVNNKWMLEDMIAAGQSIPKIDDHQDLMHSAVWESTDAMGSLGLVATWSRLMVTTDPNNEDKPIMANQTVIISWAVGTQTSQFKAAHEDAEGFGAGVIQNFDFFTPPTPLKPVAPITPPAPAPAPKGTPCGANAANGCGGGMCDTTTTPNFCRCPPSALGPDCTATLGNRYPLAGGDMFVTTSYMGGNTDLMHFRLERTQSIGWMGFGIGRPQDATMTEQQYDGMTNTDMVVVHTDKTQKWVVQDMWGTGEVIPTTDTQQDLMFAHAWADTAANTVVATWSRLLKTADAAQDNQIVASQVWVSCARGTSGIFSQATEHLHDGTGSGTAQVNLLGPQMYLGANPAVNPTQPNNMTGLLFGIPILYVIIGGAVVGVLLLGGLLYYCKSRQQSDNYLSLNSDSRMDKPLVRADMDNSFVYQPSRQTQMSSVPRAHVRPRDSSNDNRASYSASSSASSLPRSHSNSRSMSENNRNEYWDGSNDNRASYSSIPASPRSNSASSSASSLPRSHSNSRSMSENNHNEYSHPSGNDNHRNSRRNPRVSPRSTSVGGGNSYNGRR